MQQPPFQPKGLNFDWVVKFFGQQTECQDSSFLCLHDALLSSSPLLRHLMYALHPHMLLTRLQEFWRHWQVLFFSPKGIKDHIVDHQASLIEPLTKERDWGHHPCCPKSILIWRASLLYLSKVKPSSLTHLSHQVLPLSPASWKYGRRSTPQYSWRLSNKEKLGNVSPMSISRIQESKPPPCRSDSTVGKPKFRSQRATLSPEQEASNTILISTFTFGTAKYPVKLFTLPFLYITLRS